jgi:hypothetical protein
VGAADAYRAICFQARAIPGQFGLRPHTVEVGITGYTGANTGDGSPTAAWTLIHEAGGISPKVRQLKGDEIAIGNLADGAIRIGPITPDFTGGGTSVAVLMAEGIATGQMRHLRITGPMHPNGALYAIKSSDFTAALHYYLTAEPITQLAAVATGPTGDALMDGADVLTDADGNPLIVVPSQLVDPDGDALTDGADNITIT